MCTRSDPKVPGLIVVFQCALDFPKHAYAMRSIDILATHSLESFLLCSFNLEILHITWDWQSSDFFKMASSNEQRVCINFRVKLGKTATETVLMLKQAFGSAALS